MSKFEVAQVDVAPKTVLLGEAVLLDGATPESVAKYAKSKGGDGILLWIPNAPEGAVTEKGHSKFFATTTPTFVQTLQKDGTLGHPIVERHSDADVRQIGVSALAVYAFPPRGRKTNGESEVDKMFKSASPERKKAAMAAVLNAQS